MKELHELINLFLERGYSWEQIEYTCKNYWGKDCGLIEEIIEDVIVSLKEEISYWE